MNETDRRISGREVIHEVAERWVDEIAKLLAAHPACQVSIQLPTTDESSGE